MKYFFSIVILFLSFVVQADDMRPAALRFQQLDNNQSAVVWQLPIKGDNQRLAIEIVIDDQQIDFSKGVQYRADGYWISRLNIPLVDQFTLAAQGLDANQAEILVSVESISGNRQTLNLKSDREKIELDFSRGGGLLTYLWLGIEHILIGADHLLFVAALLLLVRSLKSLLMTITAFTLSHSITLIMASLGWIKVPAPPVEAAIALSIVFVAREVVLSERGQSFLSSQRPWLVAFAFGLLHGLGFASVLADIGLPESAIVSSLLMFNVGVEVGQLLFVAAVLIAVKILSRLLPASLLDRSILTYLIGSMAAFWMIERMAGF